MKGAVYFDTYYISNKIDVLKTYKIRNVGIFAIHLKSSLPIICFCVTPFPGRIALISG